MDYFPVFADLRNRQCLVVGETGLAQEKAALLERAGASVRRQAAFDPAGADDVYLIVADVEAEEAGRIVAHAETRRIFVNIVDKPAFCSFIFPAMMERGDLLVAVGTGGRSPALAGWLRRRLFQTLGREYQTALEALGRTRQQVRQLLPAYQDRKDFYQGLLDAGFVDQAAVAAPSNLEQTILDRAEEHACRSLAAEPAGSF